MNQNISLNKHELFKPGLWIYSPPVAGLIETSKNGELVLSQIIEKITTKNTSYYHLTTNSMSVALGEEPYIILGEGEQGRTALLKKYPNPHLERLNNWYTVLDQRTPIAHGKVAEAYVDGVYVFNPIITIQPPKECHELTYDASLTLPIAGRTLTWIDQSEQDMNLIVEHLNAPSK